MIWRFWALFSLICSWPNLFLVIWAFWVFAFTGGPKVLLMIWVFWAFSSLDLQWPQSMSSDLSFLSFWADPAYYNTFRKAWSSKLKVKASDRTNMQKNFSPPAGQSQRIVTLKKQKEASQKCHESTDQFMAPPSAYPAVSSLYVP